MNILITGGAGYIGSALAKSLNLSRYHYITIIDSLRYNQGAMLYDIFNNPNSHIKFIHDEIDTYLNEKYLENFDAVIHLAAIVGAPACEKCPIEATSVNLIYTEKLVKALNKTNNHPRLIFPNTNSGYGKVPNGVCTEETPLNAISLYGKTKDMAEQYIVQNYDDYIVFRLATVFGISPRPRLDLLVNTLSYSAYFEKKIDLFEGNFRRNYIALKDVVRAIKWALDFSQSEVYNLGNDKCNCTKMQLATLIQKIIPCEIKTIHKQDPDQRDYEVSNKKIMQAGFIPTVGLESTIKQLVDFFQYLPKDKIIREQVITPFKNI